MSDAPFEQSPFEQSAFEPERTLVPSTREAALGITVAEPAPATSLPPRPADDDSPVEPEPARRAKPPIGQRVRGFVRDMNPRLKEASLETRPFNVMILAGIAQGLAGGTVSASFLIIRHDIGLSDSALVALSGISGFLGLGMSFAGGFVADRVKRVLLAGVTVALFTVSTIALGVWPALWMFVVMRLTHDLFGGLSPLTGALTGTLLADYYPPEVRGRVYGARSALGAASAIPGALIGGALATVFGWHTALVVSGVACIPGVFLWLSLREPARGRWDRLRMGASEEVANQAQPPAGIAESLRAAMAVRTLRRIAYAQIFLAAGGPVLQPLLLIIVARVAGIQPLMVAIMASAQTLMGALGLSIGGTLVDRVLADRPHRVMVMIGWTFVYNTGAIVALAFIPNRWFDLIIALTQPLFSTIPQAAKDTLLTLVVPARVRAFGMQLPNLFGAIGLLMLPVAIAFAATGAVTAALILATPLLAIGTAMYFTASVDVQKDIADAQLAALTAEEMARSYDEGGRGKLLITRNLDVHYDGVQVLFGVDFEVTEGELVALLGTNGAGKSTLLRAISGLAPITGGSAYLDGRDITHAPPHELARFGVVQMPGGKGVFPNLTVRENLQAAAWLDPAELSARLARVLSLFPALAERMDLAAGALSGGEQQMVALGQALIMQPKLLLIDELSLGLAPTVVEQLLRAVEAIHAEGTAIVLVEQSVNLAVTVAERAVFMEKGEVRFSGPAADLLARPDIVRSVYLRGSTAGSPAASAPTPGAATISRQKLLSAQDVAQEAVVLQAVDIHVSYGGVKALAGASVDVAAGEIVGLIGPNGAGKTTLFDAVSGFVPISSGRVVVAGRDATLLGPDQRARLGLGRSFQDARLFPSLTVAEAIAVAMERHAASSRSAILSALWLPPVRKAERRLRSRAEALIELLGLGDYREKFVSELSTGSRRIVDLACEMAADPDVLLLDEPSSGIAQAEAEELGPLLDRVRRETGCGLLVIEHDMRLLTGIADRMIGMVRGQTIVSGSVADVTEDPTMVEAYLGTSERVLARSGTPTPTEKRSN
jgi:ABC-type branched-subunit amino acid transport system ATPase component